MFNLDKFLLIKLDDIYLFINNHNLVYNESDLYLYIITTNIYAIIMIIFCIYLIITIYNMLVSRAFRNHKMF